MMDQDKIREGVRLLLEGIGEDVNREGLLETPDRIARMCEQIFGGLYEDPGAHLAKQFQAVNNNMVLEKDILFYSVCEHHLLPFYGKAHVAYIPDGRVAGLSKLARTVEVFARRPPDTGEYDSPDCRCIGAAFAPQGRYGHAGSGAYVHDHAGRPEARQ